MTRTQFTKAFSVLALVLAFAVALMLDGTPTRADSFAVINTDDSGAGSLRQAMLDANASPGPHIITFNIPLCAGVCLIQPLSALPPLESGDTTVDGYTQSGAVMATATTSATILIEIDGTNAGEAHGLHITSAGNAVRGLAITNFARNGVRIDGIGTTGNTVSGNHIGPDAGGTSGGGHLWGGVSLDLGAQNNTIGGDEPRERNVISGNEGTGIRLSGSDTRSNTVSGNYVGTDANGTSSLPNLTGITVTGGTQENMIGGDSPGQRNVVSGNTGQGISISSAGTMSNTVSGNFVGADASGAVALPNSFVGVGISSEATHNTVGGDTSGERNVISGNGGWGVGIRDTGTMSNTVAGNYIGTDASGTQDVGNVSSGVYIHSGAQYNTVGGNAPGERNVISFNHDGVVVDGSGTSHNLVTGNHIGTDVSGTLDLGNEEYGVHIRLGAQYNTVGGDTPGERNVISGNGGDGIKMDRVGTAGNTVSGNFIGTDAAGVSPLANTGSGVFIITGAQDNIIGGDSPGEGNVISGNDGDGIIIVSDGTTGNSVSGNFIGTDASGANALANTGVGIEIGDGAQYNTIGGDAPGEGNVISANGEIGVVLGGSGTMSNTVAGNYIGTDATGTQDLGNTDFGVLVDAGAENNSIGEGNVISGNERYGIVINASKAATAGNTVFGNYIGTDATGQKALGNAWSGVALSNGAQNNTIGPGNIIAHNVLDGVEAGGSTTTGNAITQNRVFRNRDGILLFGGSHGGIGPPTITSVGLGSMEVTGTACASCTVELFANGDADGEGETYMGSTVADGSGDFTVRLLSYPGTLFLTATATDEVKGTSAFSAPYETGFSWVLLPVVQRAP